MASAWVRTLDAAISKCDEVRSSRLLVGFYFNSFFPIVFQSLILMAMFRIAVLTTLAAAVQSHDWQQEGWQGEVVGDLACDASKVDHSKVSPFSGYKPTSKLGRLAYTTRGSNAVASPPALAPLPAPTYTSRLSLSLSFAPSSLLLKII